MFKKGLIAGILIGCAALSSAAMDWSTGVFPFTERRTELVNILEAGGGQHHFSSKMALRRGIGDSRLDDEVAKLNTQFGEGRVYRFFAVADYIFPEAFRIASVQWGTPYEPMGTATGLRDFANSKSTLDRIMGSWLHEAVMKRADERFGPGAMDNFHTIADALGASAG